MPVQTFNQRLKNWAFIILLVVIVCLSMAVGYFAHQFIFAYQHEFGLLREARDIVVQNAIFELPNARTLEYGMIRGMLQSLDDPYAQFLEPAQHDIQTDQLTGRYGGVGIRLEQDQALNWRVYPLPESPALEAGILDGDLLLSVDGQPIHSDMDEVTIITMIRGPEGEEIDVKIQRLNERFTYTIARRSIPLPSVTWNLIPETPQWGIININRIAGTTVEEITTGIQNLQGQGAQGFILDLRDNGGGLIEMGVEVTRLFLTEGEIIHRQYKGEEVTIFTIDQPGPFINFPLVVLINHQTASTAEIIAGVLQSHQRAWLIGADTFGKTSIQYIFELRDGSSVHVTSGKWWIPGQIFPLHPDYPIPGDATEAVIIQAATAYLEEKVQ